MPTAKPKHKPRKPAPHHRNAAPPRAAPRPPGPRAAQSQAARPTPLGQFLFTVTGALTGSLGGALASRWGFHPTTVAAVIGGAGALAAYKLEGEGKRTFAAGAASAGGSQLLLLTLQKAQDSTKPAHDPKPEPPPTPPAPRRQSDLGALPPGALDAAFERARAALAINANPNEHLIY